MGNIIQDILSGTTNFGVLLPSIGLTDIVDIIGIAIMFYILMKWIKRTRAWTLFKGIMIVLAIWLLATGFGLNMITWIFQALFNIGILAVIIIFQPEIRRALERIGTQNLFSKALNSNTQGYGPSDRNKERIIKAVREMSDAKTGALICIEERVALGEYEQTGIPLNADISSQLLINIFEKNTPLHDGAVIISGNTVKAATCYLPLSENMDVSKELGTRHRAALGLSEVSDALIIIVSEETGSISYAHEGKLIHNVSVKDLENIILTNEKAESEEKK